MAQTIWSYTLTVDDATLLVVPEGARVLSVGQEQGNIRMWMLVDKDQPVKVDRTFLAVGTGFELPVNRRTDYLGTVPGLTDGLVCHIFELFFDAPGLPLGWKAKGHGGLADALARIAMAGSATPAKEMRRMAFEALRDVSLDEDLRAPLT